MTNGVARALLFFLSVVGAGEGFFVRTSVRPREVRLGAPFTCDVEVRHRPDQRVELKPFPKDGPFEVFGVERRRSDGPQGSVTTFAVKAALFELGEHSFPELSFEVVDGQGHTEEVKWPGPDVEGLAVSGEGEEANKLLDIKPPEVVWERSFRMLGWALLAIALAAACVGAWRWAKRPRVALAAVEPPRPADVRALVALDQLRAEGLPARGRFKDFHFRLSEILRAYLGERYGFEALECTSAELLEAVGTLSAPELPKDELRRFAEESDLVKFAKAPVGPAECDGSLEFGYRLVRQTAAVAAPHSSSHVSAPEPS